MKGASDKPGAIHWEIDTVIGKYGTHACIVTVVERKTGYLLIGKLRARTFKAANRCAKRLIRKHAKHFKTITADNGTEFHGYEDIERVTDVKCGSNENANGVVRQYLPRGTSLESLSQHQCNAIATRLNNRPRKRYGYQTLAQLLLSA